MLQYLTRQVVDNQVCADALNGWTNAVVTAGQICFSGDLDHGICYVSKLFTNDGFIS